MTRAVVFAYHNVGVRCLKVLLAHGVDVALVERAIEAARWARKVIAVGSLRVSAVGGVVADVKPDAWDEKAES